MGNLYAIVAFSLLWLLLAGFFYVLIRLLIAQARRRREGAPGTWEHGL